MFSSRPGADHRIDNADYEFAMTEPIVIGAALRDDDAAPLALGRELARFSGAPLALVHVVRYDPLTPLPAEAYEEPGRTRVLAALAELA